VFMGTGVSALGGSRVPLPAESTSASESSGKVSIVKQSEENVETFASLLGGVFGLWNGGLWVGAAFFAATAFLVRRQEGDTSKTIKGVVRSGLEVINYAGDLNEKYHVTDQVGSWLSDAVQIAKENPSTKDVATAVTSVFHQAVDSVRKFDREVDIKSTAGSCIALASTAAADSVGTLIELGKEYAATNAIGKKIDKV